MACYSPLKGWYSKDVNPKTGKRSVVFTPREAFIDMPVELACGQCRGCRLERSRQWAVRCVHEASMYDENCFVTLTYNDENLPEDGSLQLEHFQKFIKKLRKKAGSGVRYFHCGEYGEKFSRPHYHLILFNYDFRDRQLHRVNNGYRLYTSDLCNRFWSYQDHCIIGDVTFESCAYVARYIMKKRTGSHAPDHYGPLKPEYTTMSNGIGRAFFDRYNHEMYRDDFILVNGKKYALPKYYDNLKSAVDPDGLLSLKIQRQIKAEKRADNNTPERLRVREKCQALKEKRLLRGFENAN